MKTKLEHVAPKSTYITGYITYYIVYYIDYNIDDFEREARRRTVK